MTTPDASTGSDATSAHPRAEPTTLRHYTSFAFYKVDPAWRRLDPDVRAAHIDELTAVLESWADRMVVKTYSTVGIRPDTDILIWRATPEFELLREFQTDLLSTELGTWLDTPYLYTATTKESMYAKDVASTGFRKPRPLDVIPVDRKYIIVYPFVKKREWYALPHEDRGRMMRDHAIIGKKYPGVKLNTAFSFGIDDQEFMTAFETDSTHDFLDLMMELRHSEASRYTERDVPIFTCVHMGARETLEALGGSRAAVHA